MYMYRIRARREKTSLYYRCLGGDGDDGIRRRFHLLRRREAPVHIPGKVGVFGVERAGLEGGDDLEVGGGKLVRRLVALFQVFLQFLRRFFKVLEFPVFALDISVQRLGEDGPTRR